VREPSMTFGGRVPALRMPQDPPDPRQIDHAGTPDNVQVVALVKV